MIRITIYSAPSTTDPRDPEVTVRTVEESAVSERLRQIGLEWKTADYMSQRQVVITLDPVTEDDGVAVKAAVRRAAEALEGTGLL